MTNEESRKYNNDWYHKNKERIRSKKNLQQKSILDKRRLFVFNYLKEHPCIDCGENDPIVLEFDHKDITTKVSNISNLINSKCTEEKLMDEINKCEIRCANCHRRKTAIQFNWYSRIKDLV